MPDAPEDDNPCCGRGMSGGGGDNRQDRQILIFGTKGFKTMSLCSVRAYILGGCDTPLFAIPFANTCHLLYVYSMILHC